MSAQVSCKYANKYANTPNRNPLGRDTETSDLLPAMRHRMIHDPIPAQTSSKIKSPSSSQLLTSVASLGHFGGWFLRLSEIQVCLV